MREKQQNIPPPLTPQPLMNRKTLRYGIFLSLYCTAVDVFGNLR